MLLPQNQGVSTHKCTTLEPKHQSVLTPKCTKLVLKTTASQHQNATYGCTKLGPLNTKMHHVGASAPWPLYSQMHHLGAPLSATMAQHAGECGHRALCHTATILLRVDIMDDVSGLTQGPGAGITPALDSCHHQL